MLLSFGGNEDGQCGRHDFVSEDEEEGYGNFIDVAGSPSSPLSPLRKRNSERLINLGKVPSLVTFPNNVIVRSVASGSRHSMALSDDGRLFTWGWGVQGQLGHGQNKTIMTPRQIDMPVDDPVVAISAGGLHSACITSTGECYTWGSSQYGQLGHGLEVVEKITCNIPRRVMLPHVKEEGLEKGKVVVESPEEPFIAESIACGGMHTAAVDKNGKLWCWGRADSGQTGKREWIFTFFSGLVVPHMVTEIEEKVTMVACGGWHTAAVTYSGKVYTMGKEDFGILGTTVESELLSHVKLIDSMTDKHVIGVSCGGWHTVLWTDDGELYACGKGEYGRLGLGQEASVCEPVEVKIGDGVKVRSASAGGSHTLILTRSHGVFSTGRTGEGRLAIGSVTCDRILSPTKVDLYGDHVIREQEDKILQVSAGGGHSLIVKCPEQGD